MVIKMNTIGSSHGAAAINYAMDKNKSEAREPRPEFLRVNYFEMDSLTGEPPMPTEIHDQMKLLQERSRHNVKDPFFRIEICPPQEECKNWTEKEWQKCLDDAIYHLDHTDCISNKSGKILGHHTDLQHSQWVATIHRDTDNWHIHLVANRLTMDGKMQDGHRCKERAKSAANAFAQKRGWVKAEDRPNQRKNNINRDAYNILRNMTSFNFEDYFARLRARGWLVEETRDSSGVCRGYSVGEEIRKPDGKLSSVIKFKSSELGHSRDLMPSRIKATWQKIQNEKVQDARKVEKPTIKVEEPKRLATVVSSPSEPVKPSTVSCEYEGEKFEIPKHIDDVIRENIALPDEEDYEGEREGIPEMPELDEVAETAAAIFVGYIAAATTVAPSSGGGGGSTGGWRDKNDEERAKNAALQASQMHTPAHSPKVRRGRKR